MSLPSQFGDIFRNRSRKAFFLTLALLVVLGGFLRLYHLSSQSYWMDEGYTVNAVLSINEHGSAILDSGQNYSCPLYCYPTAWLTRVFGNTAFSYRLLAAIAGIIFIAIAFFVGRALLSPIAGLLAAFFAAFSYYQIAWSRQARWYTLLEVFFWLAILCFWKAMYAGKRRLGWGIGALAFTLLAIATHSIACVLVFIFAAWFLIDLWIIQRRFNIGQTLIAGATGLATVAIIGLWISPGLLPGLLAKISLHYELAYYASFYLRNYWLLILFTILYAVQKNRKTTWFLLLVLAAYLIPLSFLTDIVHYRYLFQITPVFFILGAAGILEVSNMLSKVWQKICFLVIVIALFFASGQGVWKPASMYFLESDNPSQVSGRTYYAYTPQPNWNAAYEFIKANQKAGDIVISSMPQFNKIFLQESGYWIKYSYLGFDNPDQKIIGGREFYVGAKVIDNIQQLRSILTTSHGYVVYDFMAAGGRIPEDILAFIQDNAIQVFYEKTNAYSQVWVWQF